MASSARATLRYAAGRRQGCSASSTACSATLRSTLSRCLERPSLALLSRRLLSSDNRGAQIVRALLGPPLEGCSAVMNVSRASAIDQETEQLRPIVMSAAVHHLLALVDQCEVSSAMTSPSPERIGSPIRFPSGATMVVKQPPDERP